MRALSDLIREGDLRRLSKRSAARRQRLAAGLFSHFRNIEGLRAAAVALQAKDEARRLMRPISLNLPLERRMEAYVREQARLLEAATPFQRAANVFEPFSPKIAEGLSHASERIHARIKLSFHHDPMR